MTGPRHDLYGAPCNLPRFARWFPSTPEDGNPCMGGVACHLLATKFLVVVVSREERERGRDICMKERYFAEPQQNKFEKTQ